MPVNANPAPHTAIIGSGIAGLVAALTLAHAGHRVTILERGPAPGGKLRQLAVAGYKIDAGPTVLTLRGIFDEILESAGERLDDHLTLTRADILCRHAWPDGTRLDLHADIHRNADAIAAFAGPREAQGFRAFASRAQKTWAALEHGFVRAEKPTPVSLATGAGLAGIGALLGISPFTTLARALAGHFADPRLRQLFGRYATYSGSSPFLAPATLMLIAHVEQAGVWLIDGGMHRLAQVLAALATARGATLRTHAHVATIHAPAGRVTGVQLADGEHIPADAVICNADVAALLTGRLGTAAGRAPIVGRPATPSLSALTLAMVARAEGFPLSRHTVFFGPDYPEEFDAVFNRNRMPATPTTYLCAQDRDAADGPPPTGPERLLLLVNAPPNGTAVPPEELLRCEKASLDLLRRCGLTLTPEATIRTTPADWEALFPATGGALYGRAIHHWQDSFSRPTARTRLPGLFLAGGSTHPGPGLPMAALSGRMAAATLLADRASTPRSGWTATRGGTSMR